MKALYILAVVVSSLLWSCTPRNTVQQLKHYDSPFFTLADAEGILGEPAHLHTTGMEHRIERWGEITEYATNDTDRVKGKLRIVRFTYDTYGRLSDAKKRYRVYTNLLSDGFAPDNTDFGDDGYFFRYSTVFSVVVRKYDTILTIDALLLRNDIPEDSLLRVARRITERL